MLQDIRDNSQGLISKLIIGLIIGVFDTGELNAITDVDGVVVICGDWTIHEAINRIIKSGKQ